MSETRRQFLVWPAAAFLGVLAVGCDTGAGPASVEAPPDQASKESADLKAGKGKKKLKEAGSTSGTGLLK